MSASAIPAQAGWVARTAAPTSGRSQAEYAPVIGWRIGVDYAALILWENAPRTLDELREEGVEVETIVFDPSRLPGEPREAS